MRFKIEVLLSDNSSESVVVGGFCSTIFDECRKAAVTTQQLITAIPAALFDAALRSAAGNKIKIFTSFRRRPMRFLMSALRAVNICGAAPRRYVERDALFGN